MDYAIFDGLALGDVLAGGSSPKPFRLFRVGENILTQNGRELKLTLSAEDLTSIAEYCRTKGEKIPIDSRHALFLAAERAGLSESEALKSIPSAVSALGFASLEMRDDGLYATQIELLPLAAELFKQGALRYYSPVIRGLDGKSPLRVTSIAMDNVPALNNLEMIAASGEAGVQTKTPGTGKQEEVNMTRTEIALRNLLGDSALALSDSTDETVAVKIEALAAELPELRRKAGEADKLALAAEQEQKRQIIDKAISENRATNAEREGLMKLDVAWLSAELPKRAQNAVPTAPLPEGKKGDDETEALSAEEKAFAEKMGLSAEEFLKSKKECTQK